MGYRWTNRHAGGIRVRTRVFSRFLRRHDQVLPCAHACAFVGHVSRSRAFVLSLLIPPYPPPFFLLGNRCTTASWRESRSSRESFDRDRCLGRKPSTAARWSCRLSSTSCRYFGACSCLERLRCIGLGSGVAVGRALRAVQAFFFFFCDFYANAKGSNVLLCHGRRLRLP